MSIFLQKLQVLFSSNSEIKIQDLTKRQDRIHLWMNHKCHLHTVNTIWKHNYVWTHEEAQSLVIIVLQVTSLQLLIKSVGFFKLFLKFYNWGFSGFMFSSLVHIEKITYSYLSEYYFNKFLEWMHIIKVYRLNIFLRARGLSFWEMKCISTCQW